jgi:hypothetical protein
MKLYIFGEEVFFVAQTSKRWTLLSDEILVTILLFSSGYSLMTHNVNDPYNDVGESITINGHNFDGKNLEDLIGKENTIRILGKTNLIPEKYKIFL